MSHRCRARVFHDSSYNWYWYCFDHGFLSDKLDNVPIALEDLDSHRDYKVCQRNGWWYRQVDDY